MRKIAVYTSFMKDSYRRQINAVAAEHGFEVHYFENAADFTARIGEFEVIYSHPTPAMLQQARSLKWLHSDFAGIEKYLPDEVWPHPGCILSNSSGAYGPTISEHVVMVLLMLLHRMPEYQRDIAMKQWTYLVPSRSIIGSKFVMLGTGDIGSNVARRLKALGGSVTGVCRTGKSDESAFDRVVTVSELDSVLPEADAVILALPATAGTVNILSRERIALMKEDAFVVNVGRGTAIDQEALVEALQARKIAGAALDVMVPEPLPADHPLYDCPNTIITPHMSGNMALGLTCDIDVDMFCRDLEHYAKGEMPENLVDRTIGY